MCQCCRSSSFWITLLKFALGLTSFAFFTIQYHPYNTFDYFCGSYREASGFCTIRKNIAMTTSTAFPFIIEPAVLITHFKYSQQYADFPLAVIFPAIGFLLYTISGSSMIYSSIYPPDLGTGSQLTDCIYDAVKQVYSPPDYVQRGISQGISEVIHAVNGNDSGFSPSPGLGFVVSIIFLVTGIVYLIHLFVAMCRHFRPAPIPYSLVQSNHELATVHLINT